MGFFFQLNEKAHFFIMLNVIFQIVALPLISILKITELMFSWLRLALSISGVTGVGVAFLIFSLYNTYSSQEASGCQGTETQF